MPDAKMDEAISLARRIVDEAKCDSISDAQKTRLARALIDATSPGAQYRAGAGWAAEICIEKGADDVYACASAIRRAIAALPASPVPTVGIKQALREMDFHEYAARPELDSEKASRLLMEAADFIAATLAQADSSAWKCLLTYAPERDMTEIERHIMDLNKKITGAMIMAEEFGSIDGADHKAWVIDQMIRCLTGDYYEGWVTQVCSGPERESALYQCNVGIAP